MGMGGGDGVAALYGIVIAHGQPPFAGVIIHGSPPMPESRRLRGGLGLGIFEESERPRRGVPSVFRISPCP